MTALLNGNEVAATLETRFPGAVVGSSDGDVSVRREHLLAVAPFLRDSLQLNYPEMVTAVDWWDYFEVVYFLLSLERNARLVLKTRTPDRRDVSVPSLIWVWRGVDFQEREVFDLMGVDFTGHPNMKRILLWEGFEGHPLRKDYIG